MGALDDLDDAFELTGTVEDDKLRTLYEVIVHRMREEAKHLPMNTVQQLLIERIAANYIILRSKERGELGGFNTSGAQKDYNGFWLAMTSEFNKMLGKTETMSGAEKDTLLREVRGIIVTTVSTAVADTAVREEILQRMAAAFETAQI